MRRPVRILWLWHLMLRHLGLVVLFFEEIIEHVWWVLGSWPTLAKPTLAKPTLASLFGQTDFGQR